MSDITVNQDSSNIEASASTNTNQNESTNVEKPTSEVASPTEYANTNDSAISEQTRAKYAKLESENALMKVKIREAEQTQEFINSVEEVYQNDPVAYESFRRAFKANTGKDLQSYEELYPEKTKTVSSSNGGVTTQPNNVDDFESLRLKLEYNDFLKENPQYDTTLAKDPVDRTTRDLLTRAILTKGIELHKSGVTTGLKASLKEAEKILLGSLGVDKSIEQAKIEGEILGKQSAYATGAMSSNVSLGGGNTSKDIDFSQFDFETQAKLRSLDPKTAQGMARRILESK